MLIFAILTGVGLNRMREYQNQMEGLQVEQTAQNLRSLLYLQMTQAMVRNQPAVVLRLAGSNPMELLNPQPGNYRGAKKGLKTTDISRGNWYFDEELQTLYYFAKKTIVFRGNTFKQLNFKVKLVNNSANAVKQNQGSEARFPTVDLVQLPVQPELP
ncbi:MAG TPA: hypothetical protein VIT92_02995 [Burkholderiaceae bacterium]